jgi:hypothetical protein
MSPGYWNRLERLTRAGESPVQDDWGTWVGILSTTRHVQSCGKQGGPPSKANYLKRPIVNQYREGKVKSTPQGG